MILAFVALVLAGNTELIWRFEHAGFPLSWACGIAAMLAFLAAEFCDSTAAPSRQEEEDRSSQLSPEWETVEPWI
jgi:hypothetical protein